MSELKKGYTQIVETARKMLGISRDEYALCSYLQYRAADPRQRVPGWCCDEKAEIAEFVGVTRVGLYKMANRVDGLGLIETGVSGWRVTGKWIDTEATCKQSLHDGVNKVDTTCKQSLHDGVNKVYTHNKVEYDISMNEQEEEEKDASLSSSNKTPTFKAGKKENTPPNSAEAPLTGPFTPTGETIEPQPPTVVRLYDKELPGVTLVEPAPMPEYKPDPRATTPAAIRRVNISEEIEAMRSDQFALEGFVIGRKLPREKFAEYLKDFEAEQIGLKTTYKNERELRMHFLNWSGIHHQAVQRMQQQQKPSGIPHGIRKI